MTPIELLAIDLFERPVTLRMPFRFGAATVTHCPQAFVRVQARIGGRSVVGATAELMVPKWFDKSLALSHEDNFEQLRGALRDARAAYLDGGAGTPWALSVRCGEAAIAQGVAAGLARLAAQYGAAQLDKAVADAALRAAGLGWCEGLRAGVLGDPWHRNLRVVQPERVALRHTVGLADRLRDSDPGTAPADGLPATLEAAILAQGLRFFKLKLCGDADRDGERLAAIGAVLEAEASDWRVTLDGNETFADADALARWWHQLVAAPGLQTLFERTLLLEQPIARATALNEPINGLNLPWPVIVDESDDRADVFERAIALGYRGISTKACKGLYRSLHSAALIAARPPGLILSGEDLTCQAGLAVQQDTLLAASLGVAHIERNGHHYVDGFGIASAAEAQAFAAAHPGLYRSDEGRVHLAVQDGQLDLRSLHGPGFASAAQPHWDDLQSLP